MGSRTPRWLLAAGAGLTLVSGALLTDALATTIGGGGPFAAILRIYPVCLLPGVLLLAATIWLFRDPGASRHAGLLAIAGAMLSIPLAYAGFWIGFVLAMLGAFLALRESGVASPAGATPPATGRAERWIAPVGLAVVLLVAGLLIAPQAVAASFVSTADLVNDPVAYDLQAVDVVGSGGASLSYSTNAVAQGSNCPLGYAYLVNAYANNSGQVYWYQVGLSYDWGGGTFASSGWGMSYEVFGPSGNSIFPSSPGAGTEPLSGPVNAGNSVTLTLSVGSSGVTMIASDGATHANASETYSQSGTQSFGGGLAPQFSGYFTGVMTECYTNSGGSPGLTRVAYTDQGAGQSDGGVFVDEINFSWGRLPYLPAVELTPEYSAWSTLLLPTTQSFHAYGLTLQYNSTGFVTESTG
jgi:hypothetical protein